MGIPSGARKPPGHRSRGRGCRPATSDHEAGWAASSRREPTRRLPVATAFDDESPPHTRPCGETREARVVVLDPPGIDLASVPRHSSRQDCTERQPPDLATRRAQRRRAAGDRPEPSPPRNTTDGELVGGWVEGTRCRDIAKSHLVSSTEREQRRRAQSAEGEQRPLLSAPDERPAGAAAATPARSAGNRRRAPAPMTDRGTTAIWRAIRHGGASTRNERSPRMRP